MINKSELLALLGPEIKQMIRDYNADVQGDLRVAGDALITGRMSATDLSLDGREVELGWVKDKWVWYYGSSTTILIYGEDITEIFPIGTKLRWKQGGGWLYAQTTNSSYSSGVNTLTVSGDTVTNTDIEDNYFSYQEIPPGWVDGGGASIAYTPGWNGSITNPSIGNGILSGKYVLAGDMVSFLIFLQMGSTTSYGAGYYNFTIPFSCNLLGGLVNYRILDNGVGYASGIARIEGGSTLIIYFYTPSNRFAITPTSPQTWATGDVLVISGSYIKS